MTPTKEELDEAIKYIDNYEYDPSTRKCALSILTKYRDGELVEKEQWISVKEPHNLQSEDLVWTWNGQALKRSYFKSKDEFGMRFIHVGAFHHTYNVTHYQSYTVPSPPIDKLCYFIEKKDQDGVTGLWLNRLDGGFTRDPDKAKQFPTRHEAEEFRKQYPLADCIVTEHIFLPTN